MQPVLGHSSTESQYYMVCVLTAGWTGYTRTAKTKYPAQVQVEWFERSRPIVDRSAWQLQITHVLVQILLRPCCGLPCCM